MSYMVGSECHERLQFELVNALKALHFATSEQSKLERAIDHWKAKVKDAEKDARTGVAAAVGGWLLAIWLLVCEVTR